jgi:soluble lytic murein transglycosylase-like protein
MVPLQPLTVSTGVCYELGAPPVYHKIIIDSAKRNNISVIYFDRLLYEESRYNPKARSKKGCVNIAQLNPRFYDDFKWFDNGGKDFNINNAMEQIPIAAHYLARLYKRYNNYFDTFVSYNEGPGKFAKGIQCQESVDYAYRIITGNK